MSNQNFTLSQAKKSFAHELREDWLVKDELIVKAGYAPVLRSFKSAQSFLVSTDFASLLKDEIVDGVKFRLPFDSCFFEFIINDEPIIMWVTETYDDDHAYEVKEPKILAIGFHQENGKWENEDPDGMKQRFANIYNDSKWSFAWRNAIATCIVLESNMVNKERVEAPAKLNKKRAKNGRELIRDYTVVKPLKRYFGGGESTGGGGKKRLHFRRGHWRHLPEKTTWIKWMLVGNPELGIINHHYEV